MDVGVPWVMWLSPLVGGFIGWLTNWLAIFLLFRPRRPLRIPPFTFQGLLPRRQADLARSIGEVLDSELMPVDGLLKQLDLPAMKAGMVEAVAAHVRRRLEQQWPRFLPTAVRDVAEGYLTDVAARETSLLFDRLAAETQDRIRDKLQLGRLAEEQILRLDLVELEMLIRRLARREFLHIQWLGGVIGVVVGFAQLGLWWLWGRPVDPGAGFVSPMP